MATKIISIQGDNVRAEIAPERGGMVLRMSVDGEEVLYLDPATIDDPQGKVRGGIPVLFPMAGKLDNDTYELDGKKLKMAQHGFARTMPWQVSSQDASNLEVRLTSNEKTKESFPFDFDVRIKYKASGNTLTIEQTYANLSSQPMPLAVGFHPYFVLPDVDKGRAKVTTDATRAWDNVKKTEGAFSQFDLTEKEVDMHLLDHHPTDSIIERPGRRSIRVSWDKAFVHLVVWTQKGKDFVCVEPWIGKPNGLNRADLAHVGPRETRKTWFAITLLE